MIIYIGGGIGKLLKLGGNLFSALLTDVPSAGASTAIMSVFSGFLVFLILNWN